MTKNAVLLLLAAVLGVLGLIPAGQAAAQDTYTIRPVEELSEIKSFPAQGWLTMKGLPAKEHYLFKISYLRGFLDAVQFAEIAPGQTTQILDDLSGMNLKQLADQIDKFYQDHPEYQSYPPAVVMLVILPRIKAGKPPIPLNNGNNNTEPAKPKQPVEPQKKE